MFELTALQIEALANPDGVPPRAVNPASGETYVLVPLAEYERLVDDGYDCDDTGWTREEREARMWNVGVATGWDDVDEYDDPPDEPRAES